MRSIVEVTSDYRRKMISEALKQNDIDLIKFINDMLDEQLLLVLLANVNLNDAVDLEIFRNLDLPF